MAPLSCVMKIVGDTIHRTEVCLIVVFQHAAYYNRKKATKEMLYLLALFYAPTIFLSLFGRLRISSYNWNILRDYPLSMRGGKALS